MYSEQMEMFEDGGLKDQGGTKDKVSGNDVPSGSLQKEVRDDIPAMVSEGEFIFPADVVRYHGLDKLMQMRQEAKMGLGMMEKMGQMGNSEEAELPDDLPFTVADITVIEEDNDAEMNRGGILFAQEGKYIDPETGRHTGLDINKGSSGFTDMRYRGLPDIPSQADQERAAFSDFIGGSNYQNKGPRQYKLKDGSIKTIIHDYMDRPVEAVPKGATLLPLGEGIGKPTDPNLPYKEPTTSGKKEKTTAERQAKADATAARNKEAIETSAKRLNMPVKEYEKLGFGSRLALMGLELKGARGETVTDAERNAAIEKSKEGGAFGGLLGGLGASLEKFLGKIGFDVDGDGNPFSSSKIKNPETGKWEDPITGKEETEEAPLASPTVGGKNVAEANIDANLNMRDSDDLGNVTPTTQFGQTPVGSLPSAQPNSFDGSTYDVAPTDATQMLGTPENIEMRKAEISKRNQEGSFTTPSLPSAPQPSPSNQTLDSFTTPPSTNEQTSNMLGAAQAKTSPIGADPTFTTPIKPDTINKQTQNAFDMSSSFNNTAGRSAVVNPLEAASVRATSPIGADPTFTTATQPRMSLDLDLTKEAKRIEEAKAEEARAAKNREDSFSVSSRLGKGLEGSLLSGNDKSKTDKRKLKIDAKQGTGAFADRQRKEKDRDKRRKRQDAKKAADKRVKDYKSGKQSFRGRGGR